jgi:regulator of sigma E protease
MLCQDMTLQLVSNALGIAPATTLEVHKIFAIKNSDAPVQRSDLHVNDKILEVNGKKIITENDFREIELAIPAKSSSLPYYAMTGKSM